VCCDFQLPRDRSKPLSQALLVAIKTVNKKIANTKIKVKSNSGGLTYNELSDEDEGANKLSIGHFDVAIIIMSCTNSEADSKSSVYKLLL